MSVGRHPSCQVSVVSMRTSNPDFQARSSSEIVYIRRMVDQSPALSLDRSARSQSHHRGPYITGRIAGSLRYRRWVRCTGARCCSRFSRRHLLRSPRRRPRSSLRLQWTSSTVPFSSVNTRKVCGVQRTGIPSSPAIFAGTSSPRGW